MPGDVSFHIMRWYYDAQLCHTGRRLPDWYCSVLPQDSVKVVNSSIMGERFRAACHSPQCEEVLLEIALYSPERQGRHDMVETLCTRKRGQIIPHLGQHKLKMSSSEKMYCVKYRMATYIVNCNRPLLDAVHFVSIGLPNIF